MGLRLFIENSLYFLALINPASKIFLISTNDPPFSRDEVRRLSIRSNLAAFGILLVVTAAGNFLLQSVFRVELYSLKVAGGIVLFMVGLTAVRKGHFYERQPGRGTDISIVPLAAPLIAGPGTIAAAISFSSEQGMLAAMTALSAALSVNLLLMLASRWIGRVLQRLNFTGPLVRITGLIVAAVAVQMILNGMSEWLGVVFPPMDYTGGDGGEEI